MLRHKCVFTHKDTDFGDLRKLLSPNLSSSSVQQKAVFEKPSSQQS